VTTVEVRKLVAMIFAAFPGTRSSPATAEIYERMLLDQDSAVAAAAVEKLLATSKFMPTIAEIREACLSVGVGDSKQGGEAWGELLKLVSRYGAYRTPGADFEVPDAITMRCIQALSWQALCLSESQTSDRARFVDLYDRLAASERKAQNAGQLPNQKRLDASRGTRELADTGEVIDAGAMVARLALAKKAAP